MRAWHGFVVVLGATLVLMISGCGKKEDEIRFQDLPKPPAATSTAPAAPSAPAEPAAPADGSTTQ